MKIFHSCKLCKILCISTNSSYKAKIRQIFQPPPPPKKTNNKTKQTFQWTPKASQKLQLFGFAHLASFFMKLLFSLVELCVLGLPPPILTGGNWTRLIINAVCMELVWQDWPSHTPSPFSLYWNCEICSLLWRSHCQRCDVQCVCGKPSMTTLELHSQWRLLEKDLRPFCSAELSLNDFYLILSDFIWFYLLLSFDCLDWFYCDFYCWF